MPAWLRAGVEPVATPRISHQNTASRVAVPLPTPLQRPPETVVPTSMDVHRLPSRKDAAKRRLSLASRSPLLPPVLPRWGCVAGCPWIAVVIGTTDTIGDPPPGLDTRTRFRWFKKATDE